MLFWQESDEDKPAALPDDIVDVAFRVECKVLPLDHAHALSEAVQEVLSWLADEDAAGIHLIHGAESGNGWIRPQDGENELLYVSRRTRMTLRLPKHRVEDSKELVGRTLTLGEYSLGLGEPSVRPLQAASTVFARYVVDRHDDEPAFLEESAAQIQSLGITVRKLMAGRTHLLATPHGPVRTRSLMLAELTPEESIQLQRQGVGPHRKMGCGLFIPHKGIAPVKAADKE